jgi:hypothetical protein
MEALGELPELEDRVASGELTLATVSQVQSFCEQKSKSRDEKLAIFDQVAHLSKRETERALASISPLPKRAEKVRELDGALSELRITLDSETLRKLDQIRDWLSHAAGVKDGYAEVIKRLADLGVERLNPARRVRGEKVAQIEPIRVPPGESISVPLGPAPILPNDGEIPASNRRQVWRRDESCCTYVDPRSGKRCRETSLIQIDHIRPRAQGGTHEVSNLRLRCRAHNLLAAAQAYGAAKMEGHLR